MRQAASLAGPSIWEAGEKLGVGVQRKSLLPGRELGYAPRELWTLLPFQLPVPTP